MILSTLVPGHVSRVLEQAICDGNLCTCLCRGIYRITGDVSRQIFSNTAFGRSPILQTPTLGSREDIGQKEAVT